MANAQIEPTKGYHIVKESDREGFVVLLMKNFEFDTYMVKAGAYLSYCHEYETALRRYLEALDGIKPAETR